MSNPKALQSIINETTALGFGMASDQQTGELLRALATSKPQGRLLELGTGTGIATAWLLDGMDPASTLASVDNNAEYVTVAQRHLGHDPRVSFRVADGTAFLRSAAGGAFDLIFADTWPGKYHDLDLALDLLAPGGLYIVDDLLPQPNWSADHAPKVPLFINAIEQRCDLSVVKLDWSTGLLIAARRA